MKLVASWATVLQSLDLRNVAGLYSAAQGELKDFCEAGKTAKMVSADDTDGPILASPYKDVPVSKYTAKNVCEFLLPRAQENMKKDRCNWVVSFWQ